MKAEQFDKIVENRCISIKQVLASKAKEYAKGDRLWNFKRAARVSEISPELALKGMLMKHLVSVFDMVDEAGQGIFHPDAFIDEKLGDLVNYCILLEALLKEHNESRKDTKTRKAA